jgi:DNA-directed RNA polymerase specialized sigma24 family protein
VNSTREQHAIFVQRFLRSYRLLSFIACRVLGDEQRACIAVQNCWRTVFRNPPHFEYEGAFRSWVLRALIDEALEIVRASQEEKDAASAAQTDAVLRC